MGRARITREDMEALAVHLTVDAVLLELIPPGSKILWFPGSAGHAPVIQAVAEDLHTTIPVSFLPDFGYRDTTRDAYRALSATHKALAVLAGRKM